MTMEELAVDIEEWNGPVKLTAVSTKGFWFVDSYGYVVGRRIDGGIHLAESAAEAERYIRAKNPERF